MDAPSIDSLAVEGEDKVSLLVDAAEEILTKFQEVTVQSSFWSPPSTNPSLRRELLGGLNGDENGPKFSTALSNLETANQHYKVTAASLREIVLKIRDSSEAEESQFADSESLNLRLDSLESRKRALTKEVEGKNGVVRSLMEQLRQLADDIVVWRSCPLATAQT